MKLLLLLLPVCAFAFFVPIQGKDSHGGLSEEGKLKLSKMWGIDLNARKARLERLSKKTGDHLKRTLKSEAELKERLKEIVPVKLAKGPDGNDILSIEEVNMKQGVAQYLYQGDIHLTEEQLEILENSGNGRQKRVAVTFANKWTDNTLYFAFHETFAEHMKPAVRSALAKLQENTCVNFVEDATADNQVLVYNGDGCSSAVGMSYGTQLLSLGQGCEGVGTAAHEFLHALGFDHTQSRSDRNTYVDVDLSDVNATYASNFELFQANQNILYVPYEYGSVMHYQANSFVNTEGSLSMVPKDLNYTYTMGSRTLSFYDYLMLNDHYNCNDNCNADNSAVCQNGGYPNPRNCAVCNCPRGYGGALCDQRPSGCGESREATEEWQEYRTQVGVETNMRGYRDDFTTCSDWITAPQGKAVQVRIKNMVNGFCGYGCTLAGVEIKADANTNITNPRYCCPEFNNRIITSSLNPTPIYFYNRFYVSQFDVEYRFVDGNAVSTTTPATTPKKATTTTTKATPVKTTPRKVTTPTTKPRTKPTKTPTQKPSTPAPVSPGCKNPLTFSKLTVKRMQNDLLEQHRYHSDNFFVGNWASQGYRVNGQIGQVIDAGVYETNSAVFDSLCPSLVKLRAFISGSGAEYLTIDDGEAQDLVASGWYETLPIGYCSWNRACGANRNLRSVTASDGGDIVYSTFTRQLSDLNNSPRYQGTLSGTICWLF